MLIKRKMEEGKIESIFISTILACVYVLYYYCSRLKLKASELAAIVGVV